MFQCSELAADFFPSQKWIKSKFSMVFLNIHWQLDFIIYFIHLVVIISHQFLMLFSRKSRKDSYILKWKLKAFPRRFPQCDKCWLLMAGQMLRPVASWDYYNMKDFLSFLNREFVTIVHPIRGFFEMKFSSNFPILPKFLAYFSKFA